MQVLVGFRCKFPERSEGNDERGVAVHLRADGDTGKAQEGVDELNDDDLAK